MSVDFSIVLINFNSAAYIEPCLDHIRRQNFKGTTEIIVVNNLSTDGSLDTLKNQSDIILLGSGKNIGYSGGNNLGISRSRGKYILCLNFDCLLTEDFLQRVYEAFEAFPHVGMISGKLQKLVDMQPTIYLDSTGIDFTTLIPADRGEWEYDDGQYDADVSILGPSGAAGCYRREALKSVVYRKRQYFDEQMFAYCEDIDIAWRLNLAGWRGLYVPSALAFHERGVTRRDSLWKRVGYYSTGFSNRHFTILKNLRHQDVKGRVRKLLRQEWRFISSWCGRKFARWVVAGYVMLRLVGLVFRPSFFAKRRLAHIHKKGEHLDLSMDTDYWLESYKKRIQEPLHVDCEGDSGSEIIVDKQTWLVSAQGFRNESWGKDGFFSGTIAGGQAFIEIHIPEEYQEKVNSMLFYIDLDAGTTISADIQVFSLDGKQARSDLRFLQGGRGLYKFDLEKMDLTPGLDNIHVRQGRWGAMKLNLSCGPGSKVNIRKIFFNDKVHNSHNEKMYEFSNKEINLRECRNLPLVMESKPALVYAEVCTYCNMSCTMCGRALRGISASDEGFMKQEVFEKLADVFTRGGTLAMFGWGETLLHPQFQYFLRFAKQRGMKVSFNSNGKLLTQEVARAMVKYGQDSITLSCSAGTAETYDKIHRGGKWKQLWENIAGLLNAKKLYGSGPDAKPAIYLEFISQMDNIKQLPLLVERAMRWKLSGILVANLIAHSDEFEKYRMNNPETVHIAEKYYEKAVRIQEKLRNVNPEFNLILPSFYNPLTKKFMAESETKMINELSSEFEQKFRYIEKKKMCLEPWQTFFVKFDGSVSPCCIRKRDLGNLNKQGALEIWNGPEFQKFRARMRSDKKPFECTRCHLFPGPQRYDRALDKVEEYEPL